MKCHFRLRFLLSFFLLLAGLVSGSDSDRQIVAFPAEVELIDQPSCAATTIIVRPNKETGFSPRVYVAQHPPGQSTLIPWRGSARVFVSNGLLALVTGRKDDIALSFPGLPLPQSVADFKLKSTPMVGLAVYGENESIPTEKLQQLTNPRPCSLRVASGLPEPEGGCTSGCNSGGPGATSCSAGGNGCSVSCSTGYYACCQHGTYVCTCCPKNQ